MTFISSTQTIPGGSPVPRHIAIILDGNGRWATDRHLPRAAGHRKGVEAVRARMTGLLLFVAVTSKTPGLSPKEVA